MTSLLQPGYTLTLGSQRWTGQLIGLELTLAAAPSLDGLTATFPAAAPLTAAPDDPAELTLASGEKEKTVFTGTIAAIRHAGGDPRARAQRRRGRWRSIGPPLPGSRRLPAR